MTDRTGEIHEFRSESCGFEKIRDSSFVIHGDFCGLLTNIGRGEIETTPMKDRPHNLTHRRLSPEDLVRILQELDAMDDVTDVLAALPKDAIAAWLEDGSHAEDIDAAVAGSREKEELWGMLQAAMSDEKCTEPIPPCRPLTFPIVGGDQAVEEVDPKAIWHDAATKLKEFKLWQQVRGEDPIAATQVVRRPAVAFQALAMAQTSKGQVHLAWFERVGESESGSDEEAHATDKSGFLTCAFWIEVEETDGKLFATLVVPRVPPFHSSLFNLQNRDFELKCLPRDSKSQQSVSHLKLSLQDDPDAYRRQPVEIWGDEHLHGSHMSLFGTCEISARFEDFRDATFSVRLVAGAQKGNP